MIVCPGCGYEAADDFAFCPRCATKLSAPLANPEERKIVTSLFCDLVGYTALSESADPEVVDAMLRRYYEAVRPVVESHGGTVEKFIGDAVVAVFGVPAVHEDDPERAVRAGLRIIAALEGQTRPDGSPLQARIGVNTGEALVRLDVTAASGEGFFTGDAVNVAARLQAVAPPMGVVVGASTYRETVQEIDYEELPPVPVKGKSEPLVAWLARAPISRMGVEAIDEPPTPLVGREVELACLRTLFDETTASSTPQLALVVGEPGIGKSRLVAELFGYIDALPRLITWRQGRCLPYGDGITFWALGEIVKAHAGVLETDDATTADAKLDAVLPEGVDREWFRQRLRALLGLEAPQATRQENFTAWARFLGDIAAGGPTVLVFEDLHWADDGLLAFVEHLAARAGSVPLLVIGTARPELFERHPSFAREAERMRHIALEPLTPEETERLAAALVGDAEVPDGRAAAIAARCEGNPFFAEQSARLLGDRVGDGLVPASVQAVIAARLDALPPRQKAALCNAAVVGTIFWNGAVAWLEDGDPAEVDATLRDLAGKQLVRRASRTSMLGENEFVFSHALAREVAYGQLPRVVRAAKHAAAGAWLHERAGVGLDDVAELLAYHYATAVTLASEAGDDELAVRVRDPAVDALRMAGERAMALDVRVAERQLRQALDVAGAASPKRPLLLRRWAEALYEAGQIREAATAYREAVAGFEAGDDACAVGEALFKVAAVVDDLGESGAMELCAEAVLQLRRCGDSQELAAAIARLGNFRWAAEGDPRAAIEASEESLAISRRLGQGYAPWLEMRGAARCALGDLDGLTDIRMGLETARSLGSSGEEAAILNHYAGVLTAIEGPRAAIDVLREGIDFASRKGLRTSEFAMRTREIESLDMAGEWGRALDLADEILPELERAEYFSDMDWIKSRQAVMLARRGAARQVERLVDEMLRLAAAADWASNKATLLASAAVALYQLHDLGGALRVLESWADALPLISNDFAWSGIAPEAVRIAVSCAAPGLAERVTVAISPLMPLAQHAQASCRALLDEDAGRLAESAAGFADAACGWHHFGMPYEEGQAQLGLARSLLSLGRTSEAAAALAAGRRVFVRLGAEPAVAEADDLSARFSHGDLADLQPPEAVH